MAWPVFAQRLWGSNLKRTKNEKMDFEEGKKGKREARTDYALAGAM